MPKQERAGSKSLEAGLVILLVKSCDEFCNSHDNNRRLVGVVVHCPHQPSFRPTRYNNAIYLKNLLLNLLNSFEYE